MLNKIPYSFAVKSMLILTMAVVVFHFCVIADFLPETIVWGGKITDHQILMIMESVSILINILLFLVILFYSGMVKSRINRKLLQVILWVFVVLFTLNTLGNLSATSSTETIIFTPITFLSALFCVRILSEK